MKSTCLVGVCVPLWLLCCFMVVTLNVSIGVFLWPVSVCLVLVFIHHFASLSGNCTFGCFCCLFCHVASHCVHFVSFSSTWFCIHILHLFVAFHVTFRLKIWVLPSVGGFVQYPTISTPLHALHLLWLFMCCEHTVEAQFREISKLAKLWGLH